MIGWQGGPPPRWFGEHSGKSQAPPSPPCSSFWHPLLPHPPVCLQNSTNLKSTFSTLKLGSHAMKTAHNDCLHYTHLGTISAPSDESVWLSQWKGEQWNPLLHTMLTMLTMHCIQWRAEALSAHLGDCALMPDPHMAPRCRNEEFFPANQLQWGTFLNPLKASVSALICR